MAKTIVDVYMLERHSNKIARINFLQECMKDNMQHARHVEMERMTLTSIYTAMLGLVLSGIISPTTQTIMTTTLMLPEYLLLLMLIFTGIILLILTLKWNVVFNTHKDFAMILHDMIVDALYKGDKLSDLKGDFERHFQERFACRDKYFKHMIMFYHLYPESGSLTSTEKDTSYLGTLGKGIIWVDQKISGIKLHATELFILWDILLILAPLLCMVYFGQGQAVLLVILLLLMLLVIASIRTMGTYLAYKKTINGGSKH